MLNFRTAEVESSHERLSEWSFINNRYYVLGLLSLLYLLSYIDRQMLSLLLPPIKRELLLSDTQLGFLTGVAFSLFYALVGIPVARLADRFDRRTIILVMISAWSFFTCACGFARSSLELAVARFGVGSGEAGIVPTSLSVLADYFPPNQRGTPLAIFMMAIPIGVLVGFPLAGMLGSHFGWRTAFLLLGLPGLFLAAVVRLTLRILPRGGLDAVRLRGLEHASFRETVVYIWNCRSFRGQLLAGAGTTFAYSAALQWTPSFLSRSFGMSLAEIGLWLGLSAGLFGAFGTSLGGFVADRGAERDSRWYMWVPGYALLCAVPLVAIAYTQTDKSACLVTLCGPMFLLPVFLGPSAALTQELAGPLMRATVAAISTLTLNLLGQMLGPQIAGIASDLLRPMAGANSLRYALLTTVELGLFWGVWHWFAAARTLPDDLAERHRRWPEGPQTIAGAP